MFDSWNAWMVMVGDGEVTFLELFRITLWIVCLSLKYKLKKGAYQHALSDLEAKGFTSRLYTIDWVTWTLVPLITEVSVGSCVIFYQAEF